jgi:hypothetical protein
MHENIPIILQAAINEPYGVNIDGLFDVPPMTGECLRYVLHVEGIPTGIRVFVNEWYAGKVDGGGMVIDVTDHITLEHNWLALRPSFPLKGVNVYLQPIPCADA